MSQNETNGLNPVKRNLAAKAFLGLAAISTVAWLAALAYLLINLDLFQ